MLVTDSLTSLGGQAKDEVVVAGSHAGAIAAWYCAKEGLRAVVLNDGGVGKDHAGISALALLEQWGMAAATVSRFDALIGSGQAMLSAPINNANYIARNCGVRLGDACKDAAAKLVFAPPALPIALAPPSTFRHPLAAGVQGCDSYGVIEPGDSLSIIVCGSHSALHGPAETALPISGCGGAFFHDAAAHGSHDGLARLHALDAKAIPAFAVDYRTARIGDSRSMFETGRLSACNLRGERLGVRATMTVQEAIAVLSRAALSRAALPAPHLLAAQP